MERPPRNGVRTMKMAGNERSQFPDLYLGQVGLSTAFRNYNHVFARAPRSGARNVAGGKREARNPRCRRSPNPRTPQAREGTRGDDDRGYRSLCSLTPRLIWSDLSRADNSSPAFF